MSAHDIASLYFLQPGTIINGAKYLDVLKDKLRYPSDGLDCNVFRPHGDHATCDKFFLVSNTKSTIVIFIAITQNDYTHYY